MKSRSPTGVGRGSVRNLVSQLLCTILHSRSWCLFSVSGVSSEKVWFSLTVKGTNRSLDVTRRAWIAHGLNRSVQACSKRLKGWICAIIAWSVKIRVVRELNRSMNVKVLQS